MMSRYRIVTTTNEKGWRETGHRMAASFFDRWPAEIRLTLYAEDFDPAPNERLEIRRLPAWLDEFKRQHGKDPLKRGMRSNRYDYRFDCIKFAHKIGALTDFALGVTDGIIVWLDADVFSHAPVTTAWLDGLFPSGYIAWLDRLNNHPECGMVMYRASHPYHLTFMERLRDTYTSGAVFKLAETHDSFVLQQLVMAKMAAGKIPPPVSLSGDAKNWHHPFVASRIGECLDHAKGPRKLEGRSRPRDLRTPRSEPYWAT